MANGQNENQNTPGSEGSGNDSGTLIFGKFKSIEEAEKAHKELERKFHEGNERYARLDDRLAQLETRSDEGYGRGETYQPEPVQRQQQQDNQGTQVLTRFYADPVGTIAEIEERAAQRAEARIAQRQQQNNDYNTRVARWAADNSDVAQYGDLLTHYVGQTDKRLTPERRLDQAAEMVRKRVLELKRQPKSTSQDPDQFVDGATSNHEGDAAAAAALPATGSTESQLKAFVAGRNARARKPLQHGGTRS